MIPAKRLEEIKRIVRENKQVDVNSLASELDVTEATIRRDLEKLENENFLTRTHGGAVLNTNTVKDISLFDVHVENPDIYENIGNIARQFISDNEVIFIGPGISSRYVVRNLNNKNNLTVVTTDIMVAHDCAAYSPYVTVILSGGYVNSTTLELSGQLATNSLKSLYFDESFFDIDGITLKRGYSVSSLDKAYITKTVLPLSKKSFALCPYIRFNQESSSVVGDIHLFSFVISNEHLDNSFKEYYFQNNIRLYATFNI